MKKNYTPLLITGNLSWFIDIQSIGLTSEGHKVIAHQLESDTPYAWQWCSENFESISVDQVRELQQQSLTPPVMTTVWFVYVEGSTLPAQNALLKLLEEPPPNILIICYASNEQQVLPTIASRTNVIHRSEKLLNSDTLQIYKDLHQQLIQTPPEKRLKLVSHVSSTPDITQHVKYFIEACTKELEATPHDSALIKRNRVWLDCLASLAVPAVSPKLQFDASVLSLP